MEIDFSDSDRRREILLCGIAGSLYGMTSWPVRHPKPPYPPILDYLIVGAATEVQPLFWRGLRLPRHLPPSARRRKRSAGATSQRRRDHPLTALPKASRRGWESSGERCPSARMAAHRRSDRCTSISMRSDPKEEHDRRLLIKQTIYLQMQRTYTDADDLGRKLDYLRAAAASHPKEQKDQRSISETEKATIAALDATQRSLMRMSGVMAVLAWSQEKESEVSQHETLSLPPDIRTDMEYLAAKQRVAVAAAAASHAQQKEQQNEPNAVRRQEQSEGALGKQSKEQSRMTAWIIRLLEAALRWLQTR